MTAPPSLNVLETYPKMTGWFGPVLLGKLLGRVVISDMFGQYADRRLIVAALDPAEPDELFERAQQFMPGHDNEELWTFTPDGEGAVWIDFVADLGDGFDATFAIASLLSQESLAVGDQKLPRGQLLVMGGDEVYPNADNKKYHQQLIDPYSWAFPDPHPGLLKGPPVYCLPGNHDWYDGLVIFLALFSRRHEHLHLGGWRAHQHRSYFALQLTKTWWIWGLDSQLEDDLDQPQKDYFVAIAKKMDPNSNIILCGPEPGWLYTKKKGNKSLKIVDYVACIALNHCKGVRIPLVISGDTHHYSRYEGDEAKTQFITSGGGGAFLHPTHEVAKEVDIHRSDNDIRWMRGREKKLTLATHSGAPGEDSIYPTRNESLKMLAWNLIFPFLNRSFCLVLGAVYWLLGCVAVLLPWDIWYIAPIILTLGFWGYTQKQEGNSWKVFWVSLANGIVHSATLICLAQYFHALNNAWIDPTQWHLPAVCQFIAERLALFIFPAEMIVVGGLAGAELFGTYLIISSAALDLNHNDAFSSMRADSHRHLLRIRICNEDVTIYPIGLDSVPKRSEWSPNSTNLGSPPPAYVPEPPLRPRFIEPPISIRPFPL